MSVARAAVDSLLVALFPPRCGACEAWLAARPRLGLCEPCHEVLELNDRVRCERCDLPGEVTLCERCARQLPAFERLRAPWVYGGPMADLVVATKFHGREDLAAALGRLLAEDGAARSLAAGASALVPVPLGRRRQRERGYNQSAVIARVVGAAWGLPVRYDLRRTRDTQPQSDLPLDQRRDNVRAAFVARGALSGKVVLVDDVVTSGETVSQAAAALTAAGAEPVAVVAVARAEY